MDIYETLAEAEGDGLYSITGIAQQLGKTRQLISAWVQRRNTTHFPEQCAQYRRDSQRYGPLFNLEDVRSWHQNYIPDRGGRPAVARYR